MGVLKFRYEFDLDDAETRSYDLQIDESDLRLVNAPSGDLPEWTELEFSKCEHCPLRAEDRSHYPIAVNIAQVAEEFHDRTSFEETEVRVIGPERTYAKRLPLQRGLFSILGLIMATSDCPHTRFLRPMARFHLPFASSMETIVRTVSMFLLRRHFESHANDEERFDLSQLDEHYAALNGVNRGIVERIRSIATGDADANAIIILHSLAVLLSQSLADELTEVAELFRSSGQLEAP